MIPGFGVLLPVESPGITYLGTHSNAVTGSNITFAGVPLGEPTDDRRIVCAVHLTQAGLTSATIAGVAATIHVSQREGTGKYAAAIISALVPNGTTGSVVIRKSSSGVGADIGVFRMTGASATPSDTAFSSSAGGVLGAEITLSPGRFGVAASTLGRVSSWSGGAEVYDQPSADGSAFLSGAVLSAPGTVQITHGSSSNVLVGAMWAAQ
jgi:hypothetical protein